MLTATAGLMDRQHDGTETKKACLRMKPGDTLTSELSDHGLVLFQCILQDFLGRVHFPSPLCSHRVGVMSVSGAQAFKGDIQSKSIFLSSLLWVS